MPKSKRSKVVSLTKTKKRPGLARKEDLANKVQDALADYDSVWIFAVDNMRNEYLQDVRKEWRDRGGRIFFGRNKVIVRALGDTPESEAKDGLSELAPHIKGPVGILLTSLEPEMVLSIFQQQSNHKTSYLRSGNPAPKTITYSAGPLMRGFGDEQEKVPPSLEGQLRKLGMPVQLKNGTLELVKDYTVCEQGEKLSVEGAQVLKHFWTELAHFKITPLSYWRAGKGITVLKEAPGGNDEEMAGEGLSDDDEEVSLFVQQPIQIEPVASSGKDKKRRSKNSK